MEAPTLTEVALFITMLASLEILEFRSAIILSGTKLLDIAVEATLDFDYWGLLREILSRMLNVGFDNNASFAEAYITNCVTSFNPL